MSDTADYGEPAPKRSRRSTRGANATTPNKPEKQSSRKKGRRSKNSLIVDAIDTENNDILGNEESSVEDESQNGTEEDETFQEEEQQEDYNDGDNTNNMEEEEAEAEPEVEGTGNENDNSQTTIMADTEEGPVEPGSIRSVIDISNSLTVQKSVKAPNTFSLCQDYNIELPDYEYSDSDFLKFMDYRPFFTFFKKKICNVNDKLSMMRQNQILSALYREFCFMNPNKRKEKVEKKTRKPKKKTSDSESKSSSAASRKIKPEAAPSRVSGREKKKNKSVDSDQEFEERIAAMEKADEEKEMKKLERKRQREEEKKLAEEEARRKKEAGENSEDEENKNGSDADEEEDDNRQNFDEHYEFCMVCKDGGDLLLCDTCPCSYHMKCLNPPIGKPPEGDWSCPRCMAEIFPEKIEKIMAWRWKEAPCVEIEDTRPGREGQMRKMYGIRTREMLVKYKGTSYWRCEWVAELRLEVHEPHLMRYFNNRANMDEPTLTDDTDRFEDQALAERFYKYGINPEFLEPQRVITHNEYAPNKFEYFIKWRILPYIKCTWEVIEDGLPTNDNIDEILEEEFADKEDLTDPEEIKQRDLDKTKRRKELEDENKETAKCADIRPFVKAYWDHRNTYFDPENEEEQMEQTDKKSAGKGKGKKGKKGGKGGKTKQRSSIAQAQDELENTESAVKYHIGKPKYGKCKEDAEDMYEDQPEFIPPGFKLHDYQMEGLNWLRFSWSQGTDVILADEMGLGKTIQTVIFIKSLIHEGFTNGPFLVSVPLSTLPNWEREFETWASDLYVVSYYGDRESRQIIRQHEISFDDRVMRSTKTGGRVSKSVQVKFHVLLTSYEMISMDQSTLGSIPYECLCIDEAHRLKNANSKFFRVLREYKVSHKVLLTGTPLQNTLEELFYLLNFLVPQKFDNLDNFLSNFSDLTKENQILKLHEMLGVHMLRRLKQDVLKNFATKSELLVRTNLTQEQKNIYKAVLTKNFEQLRTKSGPASTSLINIMMDLRKVCNHPYLFPISAEKAKRLSNGAYEGKELVNNCGKLQVLDKMLMKLKAKGHRVLIFSQMTRLLDLLEDYLEYKNYRYERIDGSITGQLRQEAIDRYNAPGAEQFVFLLSTKAGGLGINLATADTVIIYDSDWNPHNDIQAFSRAHRLGQKNRVMIYRFVTRDSVEERIQHTAKKKMMLTHLVVRPGMGQNKTTGMSKQEMDDILRFGTEKLFKEEDDENVIVYDDAMIDNLLDRTQEVVEKNEAEENAKLNDYLSSFKVATYKTREECEDDDNREILVQEETQVDNSQYWETLLRCHYEHEKDEEMASLGKGKRVRKQVQYKNWGVEDNVKDDADVDLQWFGGLEIIFALFFI